MTSNAELSFGQQRTWLEEKRRPATRHLTAAHEIRGPLDRAVLDRAAHAVVGRHSPLRTTFHERDGRPFGRLHEVVPPVLRVVPVASADGWMPLVEARTSAPFDISTLPLLRMTLFAIADDHHVLTVAMHRLVSDDAGMAVLLDELSDAYLAMRGGGDWLPPELPTTCAQHVERERASWRDRLLGAPAMFAAAGAAQRGGQPARSPHTVRASLGDELAAAVDAYAHRRHVAPATVLLAAWVAAVSRHSGERDILVGTTVSGRERADPERLVGPVEDVVALRLRLRTGTTFDELVTDVRNETLVAAHQRPPFAADGSALVPEPIPQLLFDTLTPPTRLFAEVSELSCRPLSLAATASRTDLELVVGTGPDRRPQLHLVADADVVQEHAAALLLEQTVDLLGHALAEPAAPVAQARPLTEERHREPVDRCAPPRTGPPAVRSVLDLVVETIARHPDVLAVRDGRRALTFAEVGRRAGRLAERLAGRGVSAGGVVALHLERSIELVIAMLASWQLGAAYVPVDPTYPRRRVEFVLRDVRAQVVVTGPATPADGFDPLDAPVVVLDAVDDDVQGPPLTARSGGSGEDPAYVLYTSGSTGQPKGVTVPHRALVNLLSSMAQVPGVTADDVVLALTSPSFDMSVPELVLPFTTGARMVIASTADARDPQRLLDLVVAERVTVMQATPVTWSGFVALAPEDLRLRLAISAGEALPRPLANDLCRVATEVWNMYGPTETTVYSLIARLRPEADDVAVPIGRPVDNTSTWVLDADLGVLPVGAVGELYLGGAGLALGYRGRPNLTAQRFVLGPPETGGERLYRTGDLVRLRADGCFEFIGRADTQVKIRGHRIEVDEIASQLRRHPRIKDAVVVAKDDGTGNRQLVAYVVPHSRP